MCEYILILNEVTVTVGGAQDLPRCVFLYFCINQFIYFYFILHYYLFIYCFLVPIKHGPIAFDRIDWKSGIM